jgi:hypothetical protein
MQAKSVQESAGRTPDARGRAPIRATRIGARRAPELRGHFSQLEPENGLFLPANLHPLGTRNEAAAGHLGSHAARN